MVKKIGFIGTGVMGKHMCSHLIDAGYELYIYNRTKSKAESLIEKGATWCNNPKEVAKNSDIIFSIVGLPQDVEETFLSSNGILAGCSNGNIVVDMTTSKPELAKEIYNEAKKKGVNSLDCPVTGGDLGAKNAALTIFCGGDREAFESILEILMVMGKNVEYVGESGNGQHAKMANQISIANIMLGTVETLVYAKNAGLDMEQIIRMVGSGSASSWQLNNMGPRMLKGDFEPGFYIKHFIKDMGIALEECEKMNIKLPGLEQVYELYNKAKHNGYEDLGTQGLYKLFE